MMNYFKIFNLEESGSIVFKIEHAKIKEFASSSSYRTSSNVKKFIEYLRHIEKQGHKDTITKDFKITIENTDNNTLIIQYKPDLAAIKYAMEIDTQKWEILDYVYTTPLGVKQVGH